MFCCNSLCDDGDIMPFHEQPANGQDVHRCMRVMLANGFDSDNHPSNSISSGALDSTANEHAINEITGNGSAGGVSGSSSNNSANTVVASTVNTPVSGTVSTSRTRFEAVRKDRSDRLAMTTTISGRRRLHTNSCYCEPETKITWVGPSSSSSA